MSTTKFEQVEIYFLLWPGEEKEEGPFNVAQLQSMWREGRINGNVLFAVSGMENWSPLSVMEDKINPPDPRTASERAEVTKQAERQFRADERRGEFEWPAPSRPKKKYHPLATVLAVMAGSIGLLLLIGSIGVLFESPESAAKSAAEMDGQAAIRMAEQFAAQSYPGFKGRYRDIDPAVSISGGEYAVAMVVDGVNAFGGPVRRKIGVIMDRDGRNWTLKTIEQSD